MTLLSEAYDGTLLDLDGTVHHSGTAIPGAVDALRQATSQHSLRHVFVTNNASRTPEQLVADLADLGIVTDRAHVFTSAQTAAGLLAQRLPPESAVLVVGGPGLTAAVVEAGLRVLDRCDGPEPPLAVVQGWYPGLAWPLLAEGAFALAAGLPWVATNLDLTLPTDRGVAPGNGSFVAALANASGRRPDAVAGKPEPAILLESARRVGLTRPLVVGDRLDTDIEGANAAGLDSLLVLTGVTTPEQLVAAPKEQRPTHVGADLSALLQPVASPPTHDGAVTTCGTASVRRTAAGGLELVMPGTGLDLLRAACAAAWSADEPPPVSAEASMSPELRAVLARSAQR
jgi:HAD superfamily hydrolase (TIGR01450 family)